MRKRRIKGRKVRNFELDASLLTTWQRMGWRSRSVRLWGIRKGWWK